MSDLVRGSGLKYKSTEGFLRGQGLSPCELRTALQVLQGKTNNECANSLCVSEKTVKFHITSINLKLGLKTKAPRISLALLCVPYLALEITEENCHQFQNFEPTVISAWAKSARAAKWRREHPERSELPVLLP